MLPTAGTLTLTRSIVGIGGDCPFEGPRLRSVPFDRWLPDTSEESPVVYVGDGELFWLRLMSAALRAKWEGTEGIGGGLAPGRRLARSNIGLLADLFRVWAKVPGCGG